MARRTDYKIQRYKTFLRIKDGGQVRFGDDDDAVMAWDINETIDTLKIGIGTGTRCLVITEKGNLATDLGLSQMSNPTIVLTAAGTTTTYQYLRSYLLTPDDLMIIQKANTQNVYWLLQSTLDDDDSHFIQRRIWHGDGTGLSAFHWYLDSRPILWSSNVTNGGIYLALKDKTPSDSWNPLFLGSTDLGSQVLGIANNDGSHAVYFYVDTSGDLNIVDEAGNTAKLVTSAGTITPVG